MIETWIITRIKTINLYYASFFENAFLSKHEESDQHKRQNVWN
jgi:hypothetical protein